MPRLPRSLLPDGFFHVTGRGVDGLAIYRNDHDRRDFLGLTWWVTDRFGWEIHALCLMTNHYHFVLDTTRAALSDGMHRLNGVYAAGFNARYGRTGHLFGERFAARAIEADAMSTWPAATSS
jgi:putative transposase